jgi:hypothetical protein
MLKSSFCTEEGNYTNFIQFPGKCKKNGALNGIVWHTGGLGPLMQYQLVHMPKIRCFEYCLPNAVSLGKTYQME